MEVMREGADTAVEEVTGADTEEDHTAAREGVEKDLAVPPEKVFHIMLTGY
nr:hypothetical protein Itr_chr15CG01910 [Ipomoea trifida]